MTATASAPRPAGLASSEVRRLSSLLEASRALSGTLDLTAAMHRVLEILGRHHGAVRSLVALLDDNTQQIQVDASDGLVKSGTRARYAVGEGITGRVVQTGRP